MNTEQHTAQPAPPAAEKPTLALLWQDVKKHKRLYYKVLAITFAVAAFLTLSIPNYYRCTVLLAPELSGSNSSTSSLSSIASSFGLKLGTGNNGSEALFPTLYPDLMNSVAFRASLFPVKVQREDEDTVETFTYYDYLLNEQRRPWWTAAVKVVVEAVSSLFAEEEPSGKVNPFRLTKEQYGVVLDMEKKVACDVDAKTLVISIDVTDQDPLIAATMADSVQLRLQEFITDYRTRKARIDLEYNKKLFAEAKERYDKAVSRSAAFNDANQHVFLDRVRSQRTKLENEVSLQYSAYSQVAAQLRLAEAKVQEDTPAFTLLQPATVPVKKAGPKRAFICLAVLFLAFVATTLHILRKEKHLSALLARLRQGSAGRTDYDDEEYYILSKYPSKPQNGLDP